MQKTKQKSSAMSKDAAKALFAKLVRESKTLDDAWRAVRRAFPRAKYGKVGEIARALSTHRTFAAAFKTAHAKTSARRAA